MDSERIALGTKALLPLDRAGMPLELCLVGCSSFKQKDTRPYEAHELYLGRLFKLAYAYATDRFDDTMIISALHGLVPPYKLLRKYDYSLAQMTPAERTDWGERIVGELLALYPMRQMNITILAGQVYVKPLASAIKREHAPWEVRNPLEGLDLFERFRWFKEQEKNDVSQ